MTLLVLLGTPGSLQTPEISTASQVNDMVADATGKNFIKDSICSGSAACYTGIQIGGAALGMVGPGGAAGAAKAAATAADAEKAATAAADTARIADAATDATKAANAGNDAAKAGDTAKAATTAADTSRTDDLLTGAACPLRSFTATTLVLMADGTQQPIADVQAGDQVLSYDPGTDTQSVQTVTALRPHTDTIVTLTLADGSQVETTATHPWWNATTRTYTRTDHLVPGDQLLTADGTTLTVASMSGPQGTQPVYNLTITGPHTYYAGNTQLLVHNISCPNADFIGDAKGTAIPTSRARLEEGLQNVATSTQPANSPGTIYNLADGTSVRVMEAKGPNVERAIYQDTNGNPVNPFTGNPPQPPKRVPPNWTQEFRDQTHVELNP